MSHNYFPWPTGGGMFPQPKMMHEPPVDKKTFAPDDQETAYGGGYEQHEKNTPKYPD